MKPASRVLRLASRVAGMGDGGQGAGWALAALVIALASCGAPAGTPNGAVRPGVEAPADAPFVHRSELIDPAPAPDFALADQTGATCRLSDSRGRVVALGFVYSTCPDICGQVRAAFLAVQDAMRERLGTDLDLLLVSTDPERDTTERVAKYTEVFQGRWRYLTGSREALAPVWEAFRVQVRTPDDAGRIAHTWMIALVDRAGRVRFRYFGQDDPRDTLLPDIAALLAETP